MEYSRQEIVGVLRKAELPEAADEAMVELLDLVNLQHAQEWGMRHGITRVREHAGDYPTEYAAITAVAGRLNPQGSGGFFRAECDPRFR